MRIGTWNLAGRWTPAHLTFLQRLRCDVLLLTEVRHDTEVPGMRCHPTSQDMAEDRWWAAIVAPDLRSLPDPHAASAAADVAGVTFCSSVLPWKNSGDQPPWTGRDNGERLAAAAAAVVTHRPDVWGGDWNTSLVGRDWAGTRRGREALMGALEELGLVVPTADESSRDTEQRTIDHVAVPAHWTVRAVEHVVPQDGGRHLSDHDAYVVEVRVP